MRVPDNDDVLSTMGYSRVAYPVSTDIGILLITKRKIRWRSSFVSTQDIVAVFEYVAVKLKCFLSAYLQALIFVQGNDVTFYICCPLIGYWRGLKDK
jgi:hypothetical protein